MFFQLLVSFPTPPNDIVVFGEETMPISLENPIDLLTETGPIPTLAPTSDLTAHPVKSPASLNLSDMPSLAVALTPPTPALTPTRTVISVSPFLKLRFNDPPIPCKYSISQVSQVILNPIAPRSEEHT